MDGNSARYQATEPAQSPFPGGGFAGRVRINLGSRRFVAALWAQSAGHAPRRPHPAQSFIGRPTPWSRRRSHRFSEPSRRNSCAITRERRRMAECLGRFPQMAHPCGITSGAMTQPRTGARAASRAQSGIALTLSVRFQPSAPWGLGQR